MEQDLPMHTHSAPDFTRWSVRVEDWDENEFVTGTPADGIHRVHVADGGVVDVLLRGSPLIAPNTVARVPVFFAGAVTSRANQPGPFFSGHTISATQGLPAILIADPTITDHPDLSLGWYLGCDRFDALAAIERLLRGIAARFGCHFLLVGGSGGGYAALAIAERLAGSASVLCWNPQTDVLKYNPRDVIRYVESAFDRENGTVDLAGARELLRAADKQTVVGEAAVARDILYLQNSGDWHVGMHVAPFVERLGLSLDGGRAFHPDGSTVVGFGSWGEGHAVPPRDVILRALTLMAQGSTPAECLEHLRRAHPAHFPELPGPEDHVPEYFWERTPTAIRISTSGPHPAGTTFAYYAMNGTRRAGVRWYESDAEFVFDPRELGGVDSLVCFVRDLAGNQRSTVINLIDP
ncbi:hypothetical protein [Cellulosimicrobium cellulans]|uniref:hypothetical protein n=1 Tax=Cellulosimicrobium cellulans TaxID=1710 RepID=UPI0028AFF99A|nr:hypothetical protein [Cellulosimicrobium cellulans]